MTQEHKTEEIDENNMQCENKCKECKEELNNNNEDIIGGMTGEDGKLEGVV